MQGVRTTKGCTSCQRRKKKCDLRTPQCARCQRLSVTCTYEPRKWVFLNERGDPSAHTGHAAAAARFSAALHATPGAFARSNSDMQTETTFWAICIPQEEPSLDGSTGGVYSAEWLLTARVLAQTDVCLRTAVHACSYSAVGWMHNRKELVQHGFKLYTQALRQANEAIADPIRAQSDSLLASCRVLSLFEVFRRSTSPSGTSDRSPPFDWERHVEGTFRMVELRGFQRHRSGHGLVLYDAVRMPAVVQALGRRKPNSFTKLSWALPLQTSLRDNLFNIACRLPELLQAIDLFVARIQQATEEDNRQQLVFQLDDLLEQCAAVAAELQHWESKALRHCTNASMVDPPHPGLAGPPGFPLIYHCKSHGKARGLVDPGLSSLDIAPMPLWISPEQYALNIAKTSSHYFQPHAGLWAAQSAIFPIMNAVFYLEQTGRRDSEVSTQMKMAFTKSPAGIVVLSFLQHVINAP